MRQPSVYSKEQIIDAALDVMRESGWGATTTRAIAKKLGSSTMPIYSQFRSREKLEFELRERCRSLLRQHQKRSYTEHRLLNAAFGYVAFARDEKNIFRFLFMDIPPSAGEGGGTTMTDTFSREMGDDALSGTVLEQLAPAGQAALVEHTWIFTHGLAMMVNAGGDGPFSNDRILELLMNAGQAFYLLEASKEHDHAGAPAVES